MRIAVIVEVADGVQGVPAADVVPAHRDGYHCNPLGLFHDGIVDRIVGRGGERHCVGIDSRAFGAGLVHRLARGDQDAGIKLCQRLQIGVRLEQEDATIPCMIPPRQHRLRLVERRLLNEPRDAVDAGLQFVADLDPAIADLGRIGSDAEGDEPALCDERHRRLDRRMERRDVADNVIRRHDQQCVATTAGRDRRQCDRRRGVASGGFEDQRLRRRTGIGKLLLDEIGVTRVGDDDRRGIAFALRAARRHLQHRLLSRQRQHLLGHLRPRHRPQARARTAGQDYGNDRTCGHASS